MGPNYYVTPAQRSNGPSKKTLLVIGGLLAAVLIGAVLLLSTSNKPSPVLLLQHLSLRLGTYQTFLSDTTTTRNLKNQDLSRLVTNSSLTIDSDINTITPLLVQVGATAKVSEAVASAEADTTSADKLEEATLNNKLDQTYAEIMAKKISSLRALLAEIAPTIKNEELFKSLQSLDTHLSDQEKSLEKITL